ncbi:hypothetical protein [Edaphobacter flagellatus]|uniref:hypothetical protein n=1 Tax=Edaphobacter flagellatus TaxID=1933044 RepID=UPI0021B160C5|nr:hypothetical protein [Edaphobacter flagellatus]
MATSFPRSLYCGISILLLASSAALAQAADSPSIAAETATASSSALLVPAQTTESPDLDAPQRGWNAGISFSSFHDSLTGWSTLAIPAASYTFNDTFSIDASIPIYMYRLADSRATKPRPNAKLVNQRGELGDAIFALHTQLEPRLFSYENTIAFTAPTGDEAYGLTTGRVTFDISNQFSHSFRYFTPILEIGGGDSATLVNTQIRKSYTSLGPLAHFQFGIAANLFHRAVFEADAYEQLPIGDQKIYSAYRKGRPTVVIGYNVTEDNGFINSLDIPLNRHITLSSYYSRSLRRSNDNVGMSITFVLRGASKEKTDEDLSFDDLIR